MKKILIVEDDSDISNLLNDLLEQNGYERSCAFSGSEALLLAEREHFDAILLDLMLPGKTGLEVVRELRTDGGVNATTPVIVLTAVADKQTVVELLSAGADDYLTKPFDTGEILARIEVQLRRSAASPTPATLPPDDSRALVFRDLTLNPEVFDGSINGERLGLSKTEFSLLQLLMSQPKKVFTKDNLYESVWGGEFMGDDNTINVHISKLRAKLAAQNPEVEYIATVWGIGFKMAD